MGDKRTEHMASRYDAHKSIRKAADEFSVGKSTLHRKIKEKNMPSSTPKQARTMAAAAHNPKFAKKVGIPVKVAKEFNSADKGKGIIKSPKAAPSINKAPMKNPFKKKVF